jgi:hypothetical protein
MAIEGGREGRVRVRGWKHRGEVGMGRREVRNGQCSTAQTKELTHHIAALIMQSSHRSWTALHILEHLNTAQKEATKARRTHREVVYSKK